MISELQCFRLVLILTNRLSFHLGQANIIYQLFPAVKKQPRKASLTPFEPRFSGSPGAAFNIYLRLAS